MNSLIRPAPLFVIAIPLSVCVFGLRFAGESEDIRRLVREVRYDEVLQQKIRHAMHRIEAKEEVVRTLIARRCSLREALAHLQELDDELAAVNAEYEKPLWLSKTEWYCEWILTKVKNLLVDRPDEEAAVLRRLEKEHQQFRAGRNMPSAMPAKRTEFSR
jgi:hypothetical protein